MATDPEVPSSIPSTTRFSEKLWVWNGVLSITEEVLKWKTSGSWSRKPIITTLVIRCATPSIRKSFAQTSPTCGDRSVSIVRLRTNTTELLLFNDDVSMEIILRRWYGDMINERGAVIGIKIGRGNWSTRRKQAPISSCLPQIPWELMCDGKPMINRLSYETAYCNAKAGGPYGTSLWRVNAHVIKTYGGMKMKLHALISALDGKWLPSRSCRFNSAKRAPVHIK
jgi:hypothetical protein